MRALPLFMLAATAAAQSPLLGTLEPTARVVTEAIADTDGDGMQELLVLTVLGDLQRHVLMRDPASKLCLHGVLQLRDPAHSLIACRDLLPTNGSEVIVADPSGTFVLPWPTNGGDAKAPLSLARRARCTIRTDTPLWSPFVQDLNGDGRLDLLMPTMAGCQPFLQRATTNQDGTIEFAQMPLLTLPVQITVDPSAMGLDDDHQGALIVPRIETADLNGDHRPDLLTRQGQKHSFQMQDENGMFAAPVELDLDQFEDSTPKAAVAPGSTIVLGDNQHLQRGDVDGDGIPDFVIAHRRKIWTFLCGPAGPQFLKARTQAVADDVSGMLLVDLNEDQHADLLTFQVQLPSIGTLILGLIQSIDIDVRAVGYRSEAAGFAALPAWRRTITIRIPSLLSLLSRQEEIVQRLFKILDKARPFVRGAFTAASAQDLALVTTDGKAIELYAMRSAPPELASVAGRRMVRTLLFEDANTVFDLDRIFGLVSGMIDQQTSRLIGDEKPLTSKALRDPAEWALLRLLAANMDENMGDEVVVVYQLTADPSRRAYDVLSFAAAR
ncbi:MAG: VCBS repeat-containing protein [Planctomycetota bacterium]|nr:VCBS repeat-containing protein [Planctomycetota bacterium]